MDRQKASGAIKKYVPTAMRLTLLALALALAVTAVGSVVSLLFGDREAPVIKGPDGDAAVVYIGDTIAFRRFVTVTDDSGKYELSWDASRLNREKEGSYTVTYTAADKAGNESEYELRVVVKARQYSEKTLMEIIEEKADLLGMKKTMSKTELVRMIYDYVNSPKKNASNANIGYQGGSNAKNQKKQSGIRSDWEIDWVEEAILTLGMDRMKGDCYSYYSVSKAFFEYFGIENVGIQRSAGSGREDTHFWSAVKVEDGWYYYDATRLGGKFSDGTNNACLITEKKLNSYEPSDHMGSFYHFKKPSGFPKISTTPID